MNIPDAHREMTHKDIMGVIVKSHRPGKPKQISKEDNDAIETALSKRIQRFMDEVIIPLQKKKEFDQAKIIWYYTVWTEGNEIRNFIKHGEELRLTNDFVDRNYIISIIEELNELSIAEIVKKYDGTMKTLMNICNSVTGWVMVQSYHDRYRSVYHDDNPLTWFTSERMRDNEYGVKWDKVYKEKLQYIIFKNF